MTVSVRTYSHVPHIEGWSVCALHAGNYRLRFRPMQIENGCFWYRIISNNVCPLRCSSSLTAACQIVTDALVRSTPSQTISSYLLNDVTALGTDNSWRTRSFLAGLENLADWYRSPVSVKEHMPRPLLTVVRLWYICTTFIKALTVSVNLPANIWRWCDV